MWHFVFALFRFWAILVNFRFLIFSALSQTLGNFILGLSEAEKLAGSGEKIIQLSQVELILERKQKKRYFFIIYIYIYIIYNDCGFHYNLIAVGIFTNIVTG